MNIFLLTILRSYKFFQGYTNRANTSNISVNALVDGQLKTFSATESSQIDSMKIEKVST